MPQVFISYSRKDSVFIDQLVADLQSAGLTVWYDLSGLDGGTQWETEIQGAIEKSQFFLAVLSPNALESKWVLREFLYAEKRGIKIIPVLYLPCELPMRMLDLQLIDLQKDIYSRNFDRLLKALDVPTRAGALANIQAEQQAQAASLAKVRSEAEEKEQFALLEKEKQEKAEARVRRQAEKEKGEAEARLRRTAAWQNWKPRLPRLAAFGILGVLLILAVLWLPELMRSVGTNLQSPRTPVVAFTATKPATVSPQASATFTTTPTKTPRPSPTITPIPAWISDFAEPVLNAISDQTPLIQDDFSKIDPMWINLGVFNPGVDCSSSKVGIFNGKLQFTADPECNAWAELSSYFNPNNFVVQVEMDLKQLDQLGTSIIGIGNYDIFSLSGDGSWQIIECVSESSCFAAHQGNLKLNTAEPVTITYISFDIRNAVYVNGVPLYYFVHKEPVTYKKFMMGIGGGNNGLISSAEFDNFKLWDLDKIKDLSSLLK